MNIASSVPSKVTVLTEKIVNGTLYL